MRASTVGEMVAVWQRLAAPLLQPRTIQMCVRCLGWVIGGRWHLRLRASVLRPVVLRWQETWLARAGQGDRERLARVVGSGRSICRQASAMFAPRWLERYPEQGVKVEPDLGAVFRLVWPRATVAYHPIEPALLHAAWEGGAHWRPDERLALALALGAGLRASELLRLTDGQLVQQPDGRLMLTGVRGKGGEICQQPILEPCDQVVLQLWPCPRRGRPVFPAENVIRRLNARLRACGWRSRHACHELRSLAICRAATLWGLEGARLFARHTNPSLTWQRYGRYFTLFGAKDAGAESVWLARDEGQGRGAVNVVEVQLDDQPFGRLNGQQPVRVDGEFVGKFGGPNEVHVLVHAPGYYTIAGP